MKNICLLIWLLEQKKGEEDEKSSLLVLYRLASPRLDSAWLGVAWLVSALSFPSNQLDFGLFILGLIRFVII